MIYVIDTELINSTDYTVEELLSLFLMNNTDFFNEENINIITTNLIKKGLCFRTINNQLEPTPLGRDLITTIMCRKTIPKKDYTELARKLQKIFPQGRKGTTAYYWRGTVNEINTKLKAFFNKYPKTKEEVIIKATENYVKSFKGNTTYMQLLKYFIEKDGGSALASFIENIDSYNVQEKEDWTSNIV